MTRPGLITWLLAAALAAGCGSGEDPVEPVEVEPAASRPSAGAADGMALFEAGRAETDATARGALYDAAAETGDPQVFAAMLSRYAGQEHTRERNQLRRGLARFPKQSVRAAAEAFPRSRRQVPWADLILDSATESDAAIVAALLDACTDRPACHRLAARAIELGDDARFEVLFAGLAAADVHHRADAASFLARVAGRLPAARRDEALGLLREGRAADPGGLSAQGYDRALEALGAR